MEQGKIRPSVTSYSLDRSLPNLITSATLLIRQFLLSLVWEIPGKYVKYNLSMTFCSVPFSCTRLEQKPVSGLHDRWLKTREIRQRCAWGFRQKNFTLTSTSPKFRKFCITKAVFSAKQIL